MATRTEDPVKAKGQLWDKLDDTRVGMLWVKDSGQHPQPMTHYADPGTESIWFITSSDTDLVAAIGHGAEAGFTLQAPSGDYQASLQGSLVVYDSAEKLDELWSYGAAAWFEHGRDDPKVTLLRYTPREASVWVSDGNPVVVGLKMMRAAMSDEKGDPDVGEHHVLHLNLAA
ncbi:pyridoxamine 5'-phosphate oxidase family protein [Marinibacterium profundimaris]|uniref:General stress protein n=1 Tax=Marinibacterium profundimaris TaxID=1679460 RepID=A0A225NP52_9RHOB|nr:pyridoxamine 5'-phosphate oxidase family protein [Marinibacterium profundimaris]OWU75710.1 general stress protein [Marinibacterium profundimaris]